MTGSRVPALLSRHLRSRVRCCATARCRRGCGLSLPAQPLSTPPEVRRVAEAPGATVALLGLSFTLLGLSASSSSKPARAEEQEDQAPEETLQSARLGMSPGARVFVWGHRAALPASEAPNGASDGDVRSPQEAPWFRRYSEAHGTLWKQIGFGPSFGVALNDQGRLFVWGSWRSREGVSRQFMHPKPLVISEEQQALRFRDVQCSESSVWALTTSGEVFVWERMPSRIAEIVTTAPTREHVANGRQLTGLNRSVQEMSVGVTHAAFVTEDGNVFCLGSNHCGECGLDPEFASSTTSYSLIQLPRHCNPALAVSCGKAHTIVLGAEGQCISWGDDSKIQLGLGDTRSAAGDERPWSGSAGYMRFLQGGEPMAPSPALRGGPDAPNFKGGRKGTKYGDFEAHCQFRPSLMMTIPLEFERQVHGTPYPPPDSVCCGDDFTIIVVRDSPDWVAAGAESNRLFCCGENGRGQCGRSLQAQQQTLAACKLPKNSFTSGLSCGSAHCLALLSRVGSKKRELWVWGSNEKGQAGIGSSAGAVCPATRLKLPRDSRLEAVCCGFLASAVICSDRGSGAATGAAASDNKGEDLSE